MLQKPETSFWLNKQRTGLAAIAVVAVFAGLYFRFSNLDGKVFWIDETLTALRAGGYTLGDMATHVVDVGIVSPADILKYQQLDPHKTVVDTINVSQEDPHSPPLYYALVRLWSGLFGMSTASMRCLSAVISIAALPAMYLLCLELFGLGGNRELSKICAALAVALTALSPLHVLYAQEARVYSLSIVAMLFANWLLLRAIRLRSVPLWCWYAVAVTLGLYMHPFFIYVVVANGAYIMLALSGTERSAAAKAFLLSAFGAFAAFGPWMLVIFKHRSEVMMDWFTYQVPVWQWLKLVCLNLARIFADFPAKYSSVYAFCAVALVLFEVVSVAVLVRKTDKRVWLLLLTLMAVPMVALMPADLILGGIRSTVARYFFSQLLAVEIAVVFCLAVALLSAQKPLKFAAIVAFALLLSVEAASDTMIASAQVWWTKGMSVFMPAAAAMVNRVDKPLLVCCYNDAGNLLTMAHLLKPSTRLEVVSPSRLPAIPTGYSCTLLYMPTAQFSDRISSRLHKQVVPLDNMGILFLIR